MKQRSAPSAGPSPQVVDEKRHTEEVAHQSILRIQRKQRLEALLHKRSSNFQYLKKIHEGGHYWLNVMLVTPEDIARMLSLGDCKSRTVNFYYLGLSVQNLLDVPPGVAAVKAFSQLMEEFEYYCAGNAMQGMKSLMAKTSTCVYPQAVQIEGDEPLTRPTVYKFNNKVVYEYLKIPHLPFELDYTEVVIALCDALHRLYEKLFVEDCWMHSILFETILRLDSRIKHLFLNLIAKEMTQYCSKNFKSEAQSIRQSMNRLF
jgi:hypothetical protein